MSAEQEMTHALPKVLIVDDSRIVRATLAKHLKDHFDLIERGDGEAGWEALVADADIQVVISDLSMPKLDGLGFLARIRASEEVRIKHIPVVIISGEEEESVKLNASSRGANDFVSKSTDKVELVTRVNAMVNMAKTLADLRSAKTVTETQATTDPVTGLGTGHLLDLQGRQMFAFAQRHQGQLGLLLLRFDQLAQATANLPAAVGERAVVLLAKLIAGKLRKEEVIAYLGDHEIAIVTATVDYNENVVLGGRLIKAIASAKINYKGEYIRTTLSVGSANTGMDFVASLDDLIALSRARLERAAGEGGGKLIYHDQAQLVTPTPMPVIQRALQMLAEGQTEALNPHLADLMRKLLPLIEHANRELELGLPIDNLHSRLLSPN